MICFSFVWAWHFRTEDGRRPGTELAQWNLCTNFWLSIKTLLQIILLWIVSVGGFWFMAAVNVTEVLFQHFWLKSRENVRIILECVLWLSSICFIVKLRSRSGEGQVKVRWRSGEGHVRVRWGSVEGQEGQSQVGSSSENFKLKDLDLSSTLFLVFTTTTTHHPPHKLFSWLFRALQDKSDGLRMGRYDSSRVRTSR